MFRCQAVRTLVTVGGRQVIVTCQAGHDDSQRTTRHGTEHSTRPAITQDGLSLTGWLAVWRTLIVDRIYQNGAGENAMLPQHV